MTRPNSRRYGVGPGQGVVGLGRAVGHDPVGRFPQRAHPVGQRGPHPGQLRAGRGQLAVERLHLGQEVCYHSSAPHRDLAHDQVDGLDAVGALVDRGDPAVAQILGHAGLLDVAHAPVNLHADRGQLDAKVGAPCFGDGRQQLGQFSPGFPLCLVMMVPGQVNRYRVGVQGRRRRSWPVK